MPAVPKVVRLTTEERLRRALSALLRRLGMVTGKFDPGDDTLIKKATEFADYSYREPKREPTEEEPLQLYDRPELDADLPF